MTGCEVAKATDSLSLMKVKQQNPFYFSKLGKDLIICLVFIALCSRDILSCPSVLETGSEVKSPQCGVGNKNLFWLFIKLVLTLHKTKKKSYHRRNYSMMGKTVTYLKPFVFLKANRSFEEEQIYYREFWDLGWPDIYFLKFPLALPLTM